MSNPNFVSIRKVISIINSCEDEQQLKNCLRLIDSYSKTLTKQGLVNSELVVQRLIKEYKQKKFQLRMIRSFVTSYRKEFYKEHQKVMA